ncbi:PQQ-like beta-propeller repeat protein [Ruania suaedae]|uniref:PQQ-like beta-propeller repeat protein n=1 Tax=Ruania suaedae TaxID=2897774 RepID=UPI001E4EB90A|nr:PQQ-like beta-propeller repeat protein [Ruania suaedae]UFU02542.1 PQQ-like beta-propeller repeat protein [Ruania suaedae]
MSKNDEFTISGEGAAHAGTEPPRRRPRAGSGPWPWALLAVVLLVGAVLTSPGGERPVAEAWSVAVEDAAAAGVWVLGSEVVATVEGDEVVARGTGDGHEQWRISVREPHCSADGDRLACVASGPPSRSTPGAITLVDAAGQTTVMQLEGAHLAVPLGEDVVVAGGSGADERWLARIDPDGAEVWRTVVEEASSNRSVPLTFAELTLTPRQIVWRYGPDEFAPPDPGMVDPATGERLPTLSAAPYTSSLPLEFERTLIHLAADSRAPDGEIAVMTGGVAEGAEGDWLWRWDVDEMPLAVSESHVRTMVNADLAASFAGGPLGYAALRTRTLQEGRIEESTTSYRSIGCPCAWAGGTLVAHGYAVADREALAQGPYRLDVLMIEGTEVVASFPRQTLMPADQGARPAGLATDGSTVFLRQDGRLLALDTP